MMRVAAWLLALPLAAGCSRAVATPAVTTHGPPFTVSGDDPFIRLSNGEQIGVGDILPGESVELVETTTIDSKGRRLVSYDFAPPTSGTSRPD